MTRTNPPPANSLLVRVRVDIAEKVACCHPVCVSLFLAGFGFVHLGFDLFFDFGVEGLVFFEGVLGTIAALGDLRAFVAEPAAAFLDEVVVEGEVNS